MLLQFKVQYYLSNNEKNKINKWYVYKFSCKVKIIQ